MTWIGAKNFSENNSNISSELWSRIIEKEKKNNYLMPGDDSVVSGQPVPIGQSAPRAKRIASRAPILTAETQGHDTSRSLGILVVHNRLVCTWSLHGAVWLKFGGVARTVSAECKTPNARCERELKCFLNA